MTSVHSDESELQYPRAWRWETDGDRLAAEYVDMDSGVTAYGPAGIVKLRLSNGDVVALWLLSTALQSKFAEELERRGVSDFVEGERIVVHRREMRASAAGHSYRAFDVAFPDRPRRSARAILGLGEIPQTQPPAEPRPLPQPEDNDQALL